MRMLLGLFSGVLLFAVAVVPSASGAFVAPTQWTRGVDARSTYQEWDRFTDPLGPNAPNSPGVPVGAVVDAAPFNSAGVANVVDSSGASFATSGGNIYSPTAAIDIDATVPNFNAPAALWTTVLLQIRTQGSELNPASVHVVADGTTYTPMDSALLFQQVLGGFGGVLQDRWFQFTIPGNSASYLVEFAGAMESTSLDKVSIDTVWTSAQSPLVESNPVPEPSTLTLLFASLLGLVAIRRRANRVAAC